MGTSSTLLRTYKAHQHCLWQEIQRQGRRTNQMMLVSLLQSSHPQSLNNIGVEQLSQLWAPLSLWNSTARGASASILIFPMHSSTWNSSLVGQWCKWDLQCSWHPNLKSVLVQGCCINQLHLKFTFSSIRSNLWKIAFTEKPGDFARSYISGMLPYLYGRHVPATSSACIRQLGQRSVQIML